jgi:hypothetical protein
MDTGISRGAAVLVALVLVGSAALAQTAGPAGPAGATRDLLDQGYLFNIIKWDSNQLPRVYERSEQLPLTLEDVSKLSDSRFGPEVIIKMIEERRCACDASVDALIGLKQAGVDQRVLQAVSLHALPPNRELDLSVLLDFEGLGGGEAVSTQARQGYLYLIIPDGPRERVFFGNLQAILAGKWQHETLVDNTDLLLPTQVRQVAFSARVPLKVHGPKKALVFTSTKPDIYTSADIPETDRAEVQEYPFEYPASSLQRTGVLQVLYKQDAMLPDKWHLARSHFQCEWD